MPSSLLSCPEFIDKISNILPLDLSFKNIRLFPKCIKRSDFREKIRATRLCSFLLHAISLFHTTFPSGENSRETQAVSKSILLILPLRVCVSATRRLTTTLNIQYSVLLMVGFRATAAQKIPRVWSHS